MVGTIDQAVSSPDSARLAEKAKGANTFLGSSVISGPDSVISIPEGSVVMRLKGGEVRFFSDKPESVNPNTNGYVPIPDGAKQVKLPEYSVYSNSRNRYITYGNPEFYYQKNKE